MVRGLILVAVTLALVGAGCGASDPLAAEEISAAVANTADSGSSRIEISGLDEGAEIVMVGVADHERGRASFHFEVAPKEWSGGREEAFRTIGRAVYLNSAAFGEVSEGERKPKPWVKFEYDEEPITLDQLLFPFPFVDPGRILSTFQKVSGKVETLGDETVRGVSTTRYRLTLDLARLIETAPQGQRAELRKELEARERKTEPVEVWIDEAGLARRIRTVVEGDPVSTDFFDFGIEADVQEPPAEQVEDLDLAFEGEESSRVEDYEEAP